MRCRLKIFFAVATDWCRTFPSDTFPRYFSRTIPIPAKNENNSPPVYETIFILNQSRLSPSVTYPGQDVFFLPRQSKLRPKWPKSETRRAESGVGFLVRGSQPPSHQLECLGERCKRPSGVWDVAPAAKRFSRVLNVQGGLSRHFNVFIVPCFTQATFASVASMDATALIPNMRVRWPLHCNICRTAHFGRLTTDPRSELLLSIRLDNFYTFYFFKLSTKLRRSVL